MPDEVILEVRHLRTSFLQGGSEMRAVDDMSYTVKKGECVAIIGESGSGKSVSALSVLRLIPYPPGVIKGGEVIFKGRDLMKLSNAEMEEIRGNEISMIFQEPSTALNPVIPIGKQIEENILIHTDLSRKEAEQRTIDLLARLDIPSPETRLKDYPFQFSGGMQQRAMIAMAMSCKPDLLIADEPTTALDVTVQAQVLEQLNYLRAEFGTALIIITHNLGIVARYADEREDHVRRQDRGGGHHRRANLSQDPHHPYTIGLIQAVPRLDLPRSHGLHTIEGEPPDMSKIPPRLLCVCHSRCPLLSDGRCRDRPALRWSSGGRAATACACFHHG